MSIPVGSVVELLGSENTRGSVVVIFPAGVLCKDEVYRVRVSPYKSGQYKRSELRVIYPQKDLT